MTKKVIKIIEDMDTRESKYFYLPPFILWIVVKYITISLFGTGAIMTIWEKDKQEHKIVAVPFFFIGLIIARTIDFIRLILYFVAGLISIFYMPIVEKQLENRYKYEIQLNKQQNNDENGA